MKKLFIHIGTHKTGTTQIQKALSKNQEALLKEKIVNIKPKKLHKSIHCLDSFTTVQLSLIKQRLTEIREEYSNEHSFIISNESFCGFKEDRLDPEPFAKRLYALSEGLDTKIILYLRRQDLFLESMYTQHIHEGNSLSFEDFLAATDPETLDWLTIITAFENKFGRNNIIIREYDRKYLPKSNSLVEDFATIVNSETLANEKLLRSYNTGYNIDALEVALICNKYFKDEEKANLRYLLQLYNSKNPFESYAYFSDEKRIEFLNKFKNSNSIINDQYLTNSSDLFDNDTHSSSENDRDIVEALACVTMRSLIGLHGGVPIKEAKKNSLINKIAFMLKKWF